MTKTDIKNFSAFGNEKFSAQEILKEAGKVYMGRRICDNCGKTKDVSGGKSCSKGHFICHSCARNHIHCPLCGHTLR